MSGKLDALQIYFGDDYHINEKVIVHHPSVGEVVEAGEEKYFSSVYALTAIPSDLKSALADIGIDYMECEDLVLFFMMTSHMPKSETKIFFGDIDFTKFKLYQRADGEFYMIDEESQITIDSYIHKKITDYICQVHHIKKKVEKAGNPFTKKILIDEDREKRNKRNNADYKSTLFPLISSMVNSEGFKYKLVEVRSMKIFEFMDSVSRIQLMNAVDHLSSGYFSGNLDTSKFDTKKLDWMADLY